MWSVRMRASKRVESRKSKVKSSKTTEIHISGAEGLYGSSEVDRIAGDYLLRAMSHSRGIPDRVVITIEKMRRKPSEISLLGISTAKCDSPEEAGEIIYGILSAAGVSRRAIGKGLRIAAGRVVTHGAALISSGSAARYEPDRERGVRVSRLGIAKDSEKRLRGRLAKKGIDTITVREAVILASKVASCKGIVAELCISDDPDYTTGYVASRKSGYVRIPNIKGRGSRRGGRVFFVREGSDIERIIEYLERRPVVVEV
jgi:6-carboxyhexanoate--CoA ligase